MARAITSDTVARATSFASRRSSAVATQRESKNRVGRRYECGPAQILMLKQGDPVAASPSTQQQAPATGPAAEDVALAASIARGEPEAMRFTVETYLPQIYAVARRMLRNDADAEEVAQETFLRVWKNAGRWVPKGARLGTWITRIAINLCYDRLRKPAHGKSQPLEGIAEPMDETPGATAKIADKDRSVVLERALQDLPERQRVAIVLVHYEEMSNIEAAAALEISVDALESLLARGRRGLKQALTPQKEELLGEVE